MSGLEKKCVESGLKMTGQRKAIIQVLADAKDHPSVEEVYQRARALDDSISIATVYRTLGILDEMNLVIRHEFQEGYSRYEIKRENNYHLVDVNSGKVLEFKNDELETLLVKIAGELGFDLVEQRIEIYGRKTKKKK